MQWINLFIPIVLFTLIGIVLVLMISELPIKRRKR